ncbi:ATP-dependent acyl-CoA ligase [Vineibacter terrae]|uniref:ATP-dependent acyl-CoA ligase n=1 Tax=Vineibacter terrae TaxID=2586908 RepID=A0A5C8PIZ2_9HYPH|nr:AMP-binding protein [Vineibacter terrae]TXL73487.1 ATP-dependent acyl-CoA ligase [Vineibacter terrae]
MRTLCEALETGAAQSGRSPCLVIPARPERDYDPAGLEWTYDDVAGRVQRLVDRYAAAGYGHGHRVALLLENRPAFMLHFLALNRLGACVVPVNPDYRHDDLTFLLRHSECDLAIGLAHRLGDLQGAVTAIASGAQVVDVAQFDDALPTARRPALASRPDHDSLGTILYTSGTTGLPKGCLLTNAYFFFAAQRYLAAGGVMRIGTACERLYNPLPLFYANSLAISNPAMILSRNAMIFPDRFHPKSWWQEVSQTRATMVHYLGIVAPVLLSQPPSGLDRAHAVKFGVGAGIDPADHAAFESRFGFPLVEVWGMSEVGIACAANAEPRRIDTRTFGRPLPEVELKVVDEEDAEVPAGTEGELVLRRSGSDPRRGLFAGYWKDAATTEEAWRHGWFHTGDIVRRDDDGLYHFVDRKKHMIRRSGQNIAAAEVEACLHQHPDIARVAVTPIADDLREEEVLACVVLRDSVAGNAELAQAITAFALQRLAYFKAPAWVLFLDELPVTATQKLQKSRIFAPGEDPTRRPGMFDCRPLKQARRAR